MEQKFNSFDDQIKNALEGDELPYDRSSWDHISSKLDAMAPAPVTYFTALTTGIVAVGVIFLSLLFILSGKTKAPDQITESATSTEITTSGRENPARIAADDTSETSQVSNDDIKIADEADAQISENTDPAGENSTYPSTPVGENDAEFFADNDDTANADSDRTDNSAPAAITETAGKSISPTGKVKPEVITGAKTIQSTESSNNKTVRTSCTGITINFDASQDYGSDAKYLWNFGDGFFSNESKPSHTFNKPGTFDVSLSVTSHTTGQITSNVVQAMIEVIEGPRARMSVHISSPSEIEVENISIGEDSAEWMVDGESIAAGTVAVLPFAPGAQNEIKLVALNQSGCADTLTRQVYYKELVDQLAIDADANAPFFPQAVSGVTFSKLYIFDAASGEQVFHSFDGSGWNPTEMKAGAEYIFLGVAKEKDHTEVYRGTVVRN